MGPELGAEQSAAKGRPGLSDAEYEWPDPGRARLATSPLTHTSRRDHVLIENIAEIPGDLGDGVDGHLILLTYTGRTRVDLDCVPNVHEERHLDLETRLQGRRLCASFCRIALEARARLRHPQVHCYGQV